MRVIYHKSSDGKLHETYKAFLEHEAKLKMVPQVEKLMDDLRVAGKLPMDDNDNFAVFAEDMPAFITENADALRKILAVSAERRGGGKKAAKPAKAAA